MQLLGIERAIMIRIGRCEALFDHGKILVAGQRTIVVGIGRCQFPGRQPPRQFTLVQRTVLVAFQPVKQG